MILYFRSSQVRGARKKNKVAAILKYRFPFHGRAIKALMLIFRKNGTSSILALTDRFDFEKGTIAIFLKTTPACLISRDPVLSKDWTTECKRSWWYTRRAFHLKLNRCKKWGVETLKYAVANAIAPIDGGVASNDQGNLAVFHWSNYPLSSANQPSQKLKKYNAISSRSHP